MSDNTKIEWADATWNVITGCSVVSAGCKHCYAMKLAGTRLQHHPSRAGLTQDTSAGPVWTGEVRFNEEWLTQPLQWKRPRRIFVCAHGDLFHENVPDEWIDRVFAVMAMAPQHTFQVLTKRPERMRDYLTNPDLEDRLTDIWRGDDPGRQTWNVLLPLHNVWLGVSVEDQDAANERIHLLLQTPAAVRWLSMEPLLGPINFEGMFANTSNPIDGRNVLDELDWVVVGGESGQKARPMHPDWVRSLRDQCAATGVPFMFKQWGEWLPMSSGQSGRIGAWSGGQFIENFGDIGALDNNMVRAGKGALGGRVLDGVQHDGYPEKQP